MKPFLLLLLPITALAGEAELACNLERSKAEVVASTLHAPSAFGTLGQDPVTVAKSAVVGVSQSFSGRAQAAKVRAAAEARCDAFKAITQLDDLARNAQLQIQHDSAEIELFHVEAGIRMAQENLAQLDAQLTARTITIQQHTDARQVLAAFETRQVALMRQLSEAITDFQPVKVLELIETSRQAESKAARLSAEAQADGGWDVTVQAGLRQSLSGGSPSTFSTIGFKYSFGHASSVTAAKRVEADTAALLLARQGGYAQTVSRQRATVEALHAAEISAAANAARQLNHLRRVRADISQVQTALAVNTTRSLDLQIKLAEIDQAGAETRARGYANLLTVLGS